MPDIALNGVNFDQLQLAVDWSISQLATPRKKRVEAIKEYVGAHYNDGGSELRVPTNFLELAVVIYSRQLAARFPNVMVSTDIRELRPQAKTMELALNQLQSEIDLDGTLKRAVVEALFSVAVVKVGIASSGEVVLGVDVGEPYADPISLDDYFIDMSAKNRASVQFEGNDYWLPVEDVKSMYGLDDVSPDAHTVIGSKGESRAESVSSSGSADLYKDKVWMRDVWLPRTRQLVTYGVLNKKLYRVIDWDGPEHGPYHTLGFSDVPGNLLPLPPVSLWRDLHELGNSLFRKLGRQADAKKTVAAFSGGNEEDITGLKNARDGEGIRYTGQKPESITVGGIDAPALAFYLQVRDLFNYFGGNLDSLGGLAPSTDTVGQDRLLAEASGARVAQMRDETIKFTKGIFKALAWYEWTNPVRERFVRKKVPGTNFGVNVKWSDETREGDYVDYNFDIDVFSMQDDSPSTKLQKVGVAMERFVVPMMPLIQAQGGQVDVQALLGLVSKLSNVPELNELVVFPDGGQQSMQAYGNPEPTIAGSSTKTYERVTRPGATRHGKDDVMSRLLLGGATQDSEMQTLGVP